MIRQRIALRALSWVLSECLAYLVAVGAGLFVPKPTRDADSQGCGLPDLGSAARRRPLLSVVIVTPLVTRPLVPTREPGRWIFR